jgi:hypothetical protein
LITQVADQLKSLSQQYEWVGKAANQFRKAGSRLAEEIAKAKGRYQDVSNALKTYATELEAAQNKADPALRDLQVAQDARRRAENIVLPASDDDDYDDEKDEKEKAKNAAGGEIQKAKARITTAKENWVTAGEKAANAIKAAIDDAVKDGSGWTEFWTNVGDWLARHWRDILDWLSTILAVLVLIAFIVIPGTQFLAVLLLASLALAIINFGVTAADLLAGTADGWDMGWAALDLILSAAGLGGASRIAFKAAQFGSKLDRLRTAVNPLLGDHYRFAELASKGFLNKAVDFGKGMSDWLGTPFKALTNRFTALAAQAGPKGERLISSFGLSDFDHAIGGNELAAYLTGKGWGWINKHTAKLGQPLALAFEAHLGPKAVFGGLSKDLLGIGKGGSGFWNKAGNAADHILPTLTGVAASWHAIDKTTGKAGDFFGAIGEGNGTEAVRIGFKIALGVL